MKKTKVLYFVDRMRHGGIQTLLIDWTRKLKEKNIDVEFLLLDDGQKYDLEDVLRDMDIKYYKLSGIWINNPFDYFKYAKAVNDFFKNHSDYDVVHLNSSSKNFLILKYAKKYNIPIRIAHSHTTDFQTKNKFKKVIGNIFKTLLNYYSTDYLACSKLAGEWLFGKKVVRSSKFHVIHNSIDYDKFKYDSQKRKDIRKELELDDKTILLGNVSRLEKPKNHSFLIDIFYEYQTINENSKMILIGTGSLEEEIHNKARKLGIENKIIFAGYKSNVNEYMQAIDIFVMPSLYEGLGIVLIEAQASGMPCIASDKVIPYEAKVNENFVFFPLKEDSKSWAKRITEFDIRRIDSISNFKKEKYFLDDTISDLMKIYLNK